MFLFDYIKKKAKTIKKTNHQIFLLILILLRLPPLYFLPFATSFLNSHSLARYLIVLLLISATLLIYLGENKLVINKKLSFLILFYFGLQSLSSLGAINILEFIIAYKNLVFAVLIYILAMINLDSERKINDVIKIFITTLFINIVYEFVIYFMPDVLFKLIRPLLYNKYWEVLELNFRRQRFFVDIYDAALIPILFYPLEKVKKIITLPISIILTALVFFFSLVSNFRTQFLMAVVSFVLTIAITFDQAKRTILQLVLIALFLYIGYAISINLIGYNSLDRLLFPIREEYVTIESRMRWWGASVDMSLSSPIFGVGLGNFFDNLANKEILKLSYFDWKNRFIQITTSHPHSIFFGTLAETGFLGFLSLLFLLGYFAKGDIDKFRSENKKEKLLIISFWSLFIFAILNPPVTLPYLMLFWLLRALIDKLYSFRHAG